MTSGALIRRLGTGDAVVLGLSAMLGAAVFAAPAPAAAAAVAGLLVGLVVAAAVAFCNAASLFDRVHRLVMDVRSDAEVVLSYKMPTCISGDRRLHVGVWRHGLSSHGWEHGRDAGLVRRHPRWDNGGGLKLPVDQAAVNLLLPDPWNRVAWRCVRTAVRLRPSVLACLLSVVLAGCGYETVGQPDECPPNTACAVPPQATPSGPGEPPSTAPMGSADVTPQVLAAVGAPDGSTTVPVPTTYLGSGSSQTEILVRVEYPDLCQQLRGAHVIESEDAVRVVGVASAVGEGPCPLRLLIGTYAVPLSAPLGVRTVSVG